MRPSGAATWITEEPDEGNLHVRVCGGIDMETYLILPGSFSISIRRFVASSGVVFL
jgi:hypothetical protein